MLRPIALLALCAPALAWAGSGIMLEKSVFVERQSHDTAGRVRRVVEPVARFNKGDQVIFMLTWRNEGAAPKSGFDITNAVPASVSFQTPGDPDALLSVDHGQHWGTLENLRVIDRETGLRRARPEDVTHIRWRVSRTVPAGASGNLSFRGIVR